jgi:hypothetical protein
MPTKVSNTLDAAYETGTKREIKAAVIRTKSGPFEFETLHLDAPRVDEVLVRIVATGICQTDAHVRDQEYQTPLPAVFGHEGAGVVEQVGSAVTSVARGDHVALSYPSCGHCRYCLSGQAPYCVRGFELCFGMKRLDGSNALAQDGAHGLRASDKDPKDNPRFVITNMKQSPQWIYERVYCQRGDIENRIKELHDLEIDRTSCTSFWANQFRVLFTAAAYVLMQELRLRAAGTACARAQVCMLRERLLKLGARVLVSVRRVVVHLPASFPFLPAFRRVALALGAATG